MIQAPSKIRVGILFGGKSVEHEVSLLSAKNIIEAIDLKKYQPILIGIDKKGIWHVLQSTRFLLHSEDPHRVALSVTSPLSTCTLNPWPGKQKISLDVIFPVLHGTNGEDGTMQGLLKLAGIPFVGSSTLGSAIGMDKDVSKRLLRDSGIPVTKFLVFHTKQIAYTDVIKQLTLPFFVKPANLGSSIGVCKVHSEKEFKKAVKEAFVYDTKILIEEYIEGREIECSVLGNEHLIASLPGEVIPFGHEFYSYDAKYIDAHGATFQVPANLSKKIVTVIQEMAIQACKVLNIDGMARVDFFLTKKGKLYVNEINTIPGFTKISMYPKLWEASGIGYTELIDKLIQLAIKRYKVEQKLQTKHGY